MKVCCYQCGNPKFGMIRYYMRGKVFCRMSCRNNYVAGRDRTPSKQFELPLPALDTMAAKR